MTRIQTLWLTCFLVLALAINAVAFAGVGEFFALGTSSRALGMGNAFAALADDEGAVLHNPSTLGTFDGFGASSVFMSQFGGVTYASVSIAAKYLGACVSLLDSGTIETNTGSLRYSSQGIVLGAGAPLGPFGLGARWRFLNVSAPTSGSGWSLDPCLTFFTRSLKLAAILESSLSSGMEYDSGSVEPFLASLTVGAAATLEPVEDVDWNLVFQVDGLLTGSTRFAIGLEAWIQGLGARVGYDGQGVTFGVSARFMRFQFDWAYALRGDLGGSHRAGLTLRW